jgi:hypothetical protein
MVSKFTALLTLLLQLLVCVQKIIGSNSYYDYMITIAVNFLTSLVVLTVILSIEFVGFIGATYSSTGKIFFLSLIALHYMMVKYVIPCVENYTKKVHHKN